VQAYAHVRREDLRQMVMLSKADTSSSMAMISKEGQKSQQQPSLQMVMDGKPGMKSKTQVEGGGCIHCGNMKHTKEACFKLHGYPDWWHELKTNKKSESGCVALVSAESTSSSSIKPHLSLISQEDFSPAAANYSLAQNESGNQDWIIDYWATDHMTYDPQDFIETTQPKRTCITNANSEKYPVTRAGEVALSSSFSLSNTLLVPTLSNKLLSVGQVTEDLNCCALIYPKICLF